MLLLIVCRVAFHRGVRRYSGYRRLTGRCHAVNRHPSYFRVFLTFARNSLVRDMTFRSNFIIEVISSMSWVLMNLGFYLLIFSLHAQIGRGHRLGQVRVLRLPRDHDVRQQPGPGVLHAQRRGVQRTDSHRRARLRPAQADRHAVPGLAAARRTGRRWRISILALLLLGYALARMSYTPTARCRCVLYLPYIVCGVAILYSLMISLAATSIWLGRNQSLYNFWFYITNFSRYPMEIYRGSVAGDACAGCSPSSSRCWSSSMCPPA